jgi:ankyrin repeat protein
MTAEYIESLNILSQEIYKLPKLSIEDICLEQIPDSNKKYLYGFYEYYDELDKFNIKELNHFNNYGFYNKNILMIASYYNKIRLIKYLLARGIDINISNKSGYNSYLFHCLNNYVKIKTLKLLEDNGANIHKISDFKYNAFLFAIYSNKRKIIKVLEHLKSKFIDIYKINYRGCNACFYAHNVKIFKYLESNGFNIHIKDTDNLNVYSYIINFRTTQDKHKFRLLKYLKQRGVHTYYSKNYNYCKRNNYYKPLKYLLISNCNNRFKNITCYI